MRVDKNANRQRGPRKSALWCHRICDRAYFPQISKPFHKFQLICTRAQKDAVISANKQTQERKTSRSYDGGQRRFEQFKRNCKISKVGHPYLVSLLGVQRSDAFLGPTIKQLSMGLIWSSSDHLTVIIIKIKKTPPWFFCKPPCSSLVGRTLWLPSPKQPSAPVSWDWYMIWYGSMGYDTGWFFLTPPPHVQYRRN